MEQLKAGERLPLNFTNSLFNVYSNIFFKSYQGFYNLKTMVTVQGTPVKSTAEYGYRVFYTDKMSNVNDVHSAHFLVMREGTDTTNPNLLSGTNISLSSPDAVITITTDTIANWSWNNPETSIDYVVFLRTIKFRLDVVSKSYIQIKHAINTSFTENLNLYSNVLVFYTNPSDEYPDNTLPLNIGKHYVIPSFPSKPIFDVANIFLMQDRTYDSEYREVFYWAVNDVMVGIPQLRKVYQTTLNLSNYNYIRPKYADGNSGGWVDLTLLEHYDHTVVFDGVTFFYFMFFGQNSFNDLRGLVDIQLTTNIDPSVGATVDNDVMVSINTLNTDEYNKKVNTLDKLHMEGDVNSNFNTYNALDIIELASKNLHRFNEWYNLYITRKDVVSNSSHRLEFGTDIDVYNNNLLKVLDLFDNASATIKDLPFTKVPFTFSKGYIT